MSIEKKLGKKPKTLDKNVLLDLTRKIHSEIKKISRDEAKSIAKQKASGNIRIIDGGKSIFYFDQQSCANLEDD
jgi:uncharacterized membrane protein YkoI